MKTRVDQQREIFDEFRADASDPRYRKFLKALDGVAPGEVLEIGCSGGAFLEELRDRGWAPTGIEISDAAAQSARDRGLDVRTGDAIEGLPFPDARFDCLVAGEIVEHTLDPLAFLRECHRVLRAPGLFLLSTPNLLSLKNRLLMLAGRDPRFVLAEYHYRVFTPRSIRTLLRASPFAEFEVRGNYVLFSRNRQRHFGALFERAADFMPAWSEHFVVVARKCENAAMNGGVALP